MEQRSLRSFDSTVQVNLRLQSVIIESIQTVEPLVHGEILSMPLLCCLIALIFMTLHIPRALSQAGSSLNLFNSKDSGCPDLTVVIPPKVNDAGFGMWLRDETVRTLSRSKNLKCFQAVESEKAASTLTFIGYSAFDALTLKDLKSKQLEIMQTDLGATQVALLSYRGSKDPSIMVSLYKLAANPEDEDEIEPRLVKKFQIRIDPKTMVDKKTPVLTRFIPFFAPNSMTIGISYTEISMNAGRDDWFRKETEVVSKLPAFLSTVSFARIAHPDRYGMFDVSFNLSPRLLFFALDQFTTINNFEARADLPGAEEREIHLQVTGSCGNIEGIGSLYWPLGRTYLALGLGPCLYGRTTNTQDLNILFDYDTALRVGHTAFITRQFYSFLEIEGFFFGKPLYHDEYIESSTMTRSTLGVGYYFPSAEYKISSWF